MVAFGKLLTLCAAVGSRAQSMDPGCSTPEACPGKEHTSRDSVLLQTSRGLATLKAAATETSASSGNGRVTTDCAQRLTMFDERHAACVVVKENRALLVWVPYGHAPGWDLPGGQHHHGEAACETAEREVCEETGFQVRAKRQLSYNVFECEIVAENVCRRPVDEGFLRKTWVQRQEVGELQYRGGTWGDKQGLLRSALLSSTPQPDWRDACGCKMCQGEGFSRHTQQCSVGHTTEVNEVSVCLRESSQQADEDACGCKPAEEKGWSSTVGMCAEGHDTDPEEGCECQRRAGRSSSAQIS
jgi:8-oxo-dGTP pyrophosphatase MutT (NUDIX family)